MTSTYEHWKTTIAAIRVGLCLQSFIHDQTPLQPTLYSLQLLPDQFKMPPQIPHLRLTPTSKQLIVDGKPFLMRAGELQNSSMSSAKYMAETWPKLVEANFNTVLGSVAWEQIEPEEGKFDFTDLDACLQGAREHGLRLVLLWFGSFKNGLLSLGSDGVYIEG